MRALFCLALLLGSASGCFRTAAAPTTSLRLAAPSVPKGAKVTIDDQVLGSLDFVIKRGVALPPGKHRITIEAPGYLPWDAEVDVSDKGGLVNLDVRLIPIPD